MLINIDNIKPLIKPTSLEIGISNISGKIEFSELLDKLGVLDAIWCLRVTDTEAEQYDVAFKIIMRIRHLVDDPEGVNTAIDYYYDIASADELEKANDIAYKSWMANQTEANWAAFCITRIHEDCDPTDLLYDVAEGAIDANPEIEQTIKTMLLEVFA